MICFNCESGEPIEKISAVSGTVRGESYTVFVPAMACPQCGEIVLDARQGAAYSLAITDAYRRAHHLLTSTEIKAARERLGLTQQQFADHVGVGVASIRRWEAGALQDESSDKLIRLCSDLLFARANVSRIETMLQGEISSRRVRPIRVRWSSMQLEVSPREDEQLARQSDDSAASTDRTCSSNLYAA